MAYFYVNMRHHLILIREFKKTEGLHKMTRVVFSRVSLVTVLTVTNAVNNSRVS